MHSFFYGKMDFDVEEQTEIYLPDAFDNARSLWLKNTSDSKLSARKLLQRYLRAWFVPIGITDSENLFPDQSDVDALKIVILDLDFSYNLIPRCEAEAWFKVKVTSDFKSLNLDEWQEV